MDESKCIKNKKIRRWIIIISACVFFAFIIVSFSFYIYIKQYVKKDTFSDGIYINDIDVSGMTKEEVYKKIEKYIEDIEKKKLTLKYEDYSKAISFDKLGFSAKNKEVIEDAYNLGKEGSLLNRYKRIKSLRNKPEKFVIEFEYDIKKLDKFIDSIKNNFYQKPKNAIIQRINNEFVIKEEIVGYVLDVQETKKDIVPLLEEGTDNIEIKLTVDVEVPDYTKEYYEVIKDPLGVFYTQFNASNIPRTENLKVGASKINGVILHPNDSFSAHDQLSPVNEANGYKAAPIIVNGVLEDGLGGGICQVATTLYNAVLLSELEVLERKNHSMKITYSEISMDAALYGDILDFKFKNSTDYPIYIESYIEGDRLYMNIYGNDQRDDNREIKFEPVIIERITPPPAKIIYDDAMAEGEEKIVQSEVYGYKAKLYKHIYIDGEYKEKMLVNYSNYKATPAIIKKGTNSHNNSSDEDMESEDNETEETEGIEEEEIEHIEVEEKVNEDNNE
ncbi:MAG: VanW family protein, partial [Eubacteriales bacterium]